MADHPVVYCPHCEARLDQGQDLEGSDATPQPFDLTVCLHCAAPLQFTEAMTVHELGVLDILALPAEEGRTLITAVISVWEHLHPPERS